MIKNIYGPTLEVFIVVYDLMNTITIFYCLGQAHSVQLYFAESSAQQSLPS